jgi:uncharacterized protein DUF4279
MSIGSDNDVSCVQTYATLRIFHRDLDPEKVSRELGIAASEGWKRGEPKSATDRRPVIARYGGWLLRTPKEMSSRDAECHLTWLLDRVGPRRDLLHRLQAAGCETSISCFWVSRPSHGGVTLAAQVLERLAGMGLELEFDVFFQQEEELTK